MLLRTKNVSCVLCYNTFIFFPLHRNPGRQTSDYARACIAFTRNLHHSLLLFNHEISNALRNSISGINDICLRVRDCLQEMDLQDTLYENIKAAAITNETKSCSLPNIDAQMQQQQQQQQYEEIDTDAVVLPVLTQSENQVRLG